MERPREDLDILLVEDNPGDARLIEHHLSQGDGTFTPPLLTHVESLSEGFDELRWGAYDLVVLDLGLPESSGLETLDRYMDHTAGRPDAATPVVVLTGLNDDETALRAVKRGAQDYLVKDTLDGTVLHRTIRHALERHRQERELTIMKQVLGRVLRHNIRNDLSIIRGHSVEISERGDRDIREHADVIRRRSEDLLAVSEKAHAIESIVEYDGTAVQQPLADVLVDAVEDVRTEYPNASVTVETDARPLVRAHPKLSLAMTNLLSVALDGIDDPDPAVTVCLRAEEETVIITVDGVGVAIPETDIEAVRAGQETPLEHASGVGLWLVYLIINRSDARLRLDGDAVARVTFQRTD